MVGGERIKVCDTVPNENRACVCGGLKCLSTGDLYVCVHDQLSCV